jgi:peptidoglycan-N-acetylglucosamine deacetylase
VAPGLRGGATVLLHDADHAAAAGAWRATVAALPRIADLVAARGLVFGPLGDHGLPARRGEEFDTLEAR